MSILKMLMAGLEIRQWESTNLASIPSTAQTTTVKTLCKVKGVQIQICMFWLCEISKTGQFIKTEVG